ncbi:MAG: radical SAM protein [Pseudomonadales bacterium]
MNIIAKEPGRFVDPLVTAEGKTRAQVSVSALKTLWLNTGTLCNLACANCYIESTPRNDRLAYLTRADVAAYLREIQQHSLPVSEIGITGGEPFMNPDIVPILEDCVGAGFSVLVLTNAMRPMMKCADALLDLNQRYPEQLTLRVSVDHYEQSLHEEERGDRSWKPMLNGLRWLSESGICVHAAGRTRWGDDEGELRSGFSRLFQQIGVDIDAADPAALLLFPEMDASANVPEITTECWGVLGVDPQEMMCASARMVVRRKGAAEPEVVACTLLPYEPEFSYGSSLLGSLGPVSLNHPHCARFCVLGGGSCSA